MTSRPLKARESKTGAKRGPAPSAEPPKVRREPHEFHNRLKAGQTPEEGSAEMVVEGLGMNAVAAVAFSEKLAPVDVTEAFAQTIQTVRKIVAGDRKSLEAILAAQVLALNAIFTDCVMLGRANINNPEAFERLMRIGLRAQGSGRATAESIALMQNPPTIFAKQANVSNGPQQVNNTMQAKANPMEHPDPMEGRVTVSRVRAGKSESRPIKLLESRNHGKRLDPGTAGATTPSDTPLATVEAINGTADGSGESARVPKRVQRRRTPAVARRTPQAASAARGIR